MRLADKFISWIKNGQKGQVEVLRFFTFVIIALLIVTLVLPPLFDLFSPRLTTSSAIELLQNQGYLVLAQGACYPGEFIPCVSGTQSLGSDTNRWKDLWLTSPTIYLGNITLSNSGTQLDIDGQLVLHGGGKVWKEIQLDLDYATIRAFGKPTQVYRGVHPGFSLPIYNNDNEELYASMDVPREWDGVTNPILHIHCYADAPIDGTWVSPTSFNDLGGWKNEENAYDENTSTYAENVVGASSWTNFLELEHSTMLCDKVRYYFDSIYTDITIIDLDVYYNDSWHDVYQGNYNIGSWIERSLGDGYNVTKTRVRFYNSNDTEISLAKLHEFDFHSLDNSEGNIKLEVAWDYYSPKDNDFVTDSPIIITKEVQIISGYYPSFSIDIILDDGMPIGGLLACDELGIRLRRIVTSQNELLEEVVITHIGVQFLRDKLGEVTP